MDHQLLANIISRSIGSGAAAKAKITGQLEDLAWSVAMGTDPMTLEAFTVNGQSFSGKSVSIMDQIKILELVQKNQADGVSYRSGHRRISFG